MAKGQGKSGQKSLTTETKQERFIRVVIPRVNKAIKAIEVIGFCAGSSYEYTESQVDDILAALKFSVDSLADSFAGKTGSGGRFKLTR